MERTGIEPDASRVLGAPLVVRARRGQCLQHGLGEDRATCGVRRLRRPVAPGRKAADRTREMELNGALSNPRAGVELVRLRVLHDVLLRKALANPREPRPVPAKLSPVLETVTRVLE